MPSEFALIERHFARRARAAAAAQAADKTAATGIFTALGIGDDCALLTPTVGSQLAVSTDTLVAGRHFFDDVDPAALGHKALAVNLSDLAAMGAMPRAFTLALTLPQADDKWLAAFADGLFALADRYRCELVGGDTTGGPLAINITVFGEVESGRALRRDGAQAGDDIWVTGTLGDARLALGLRRGEWLAPTLSAAQLAQLQCAMERPEPRVAAGQALRGIAHAALDLSDGLAGDLAHILERSGVRAIVDVDAMPRSSILSRQPLAVQRLCGIAGGDDYELCFTASATMRAAIATQAAELALPITRIGRIVSDAAQARAYAPHAPDPQAPGGADQPSQTLVHDNSYIVWQDGAGHSLPPAEAAAFRGFEHFHAD
ncbi:MAG: thiamine-phosphate kinase [Janthinobacterium lividum]